MSDLSWKTAITKIEPNNIMVKGYRVDEMMGKLSFPRAIYLILKGELPTENIGKMMDAMLVSSIDHGTTPPSTLAAITVASTGSTLNAALASGILAINKFHGGAIEGCMNVLMEIKKIRDENGLSTDEAVKNVLNEYREKKKRIPGFGHRFHTKDPRSVKLFSLAEEYGVAADFVAISRSIEESLQTVLGNPLPINVDGAIATILCELDFPPALANAFFIMARVPGLVAHIVEEQTRQKPMRKIHPTDSVYDGPEERKLI